MNLTSLLPFGLVSYWVALALGFGIVRLLATERLASFSQGFTATFRLVCRGVRLPRSS